MRLIYEHNITFECIHYIPFTLTYEYIGYIPYMTLTHEYPFIIFHL